MFLTRREWIKSRPPPPSVDEAVGQIRAHLDTREERFLEAIDRCVWSHASSPYLPLLRAARCEPGDVRESVKRSGFEGALRLLRDAGVYVTFEEFKGRRPIERNGVSFAVSPEDFDNPRRDPRFPDSTGGSTGQGVTVWTSLEDAQRWIAHGVVAREAHGLTGLPLAGWTSPSLDALIRFMSLPSDSQRKVFVIRLERGLVDALGYSLASRLLRLGVRVSGLVLPEEESVDAQDPLPVLLWAEAAIDRHGRCAIEASISSAVRIAVAAMENNIDLTGVSIAGAGEPATPAKVAVVRKSGARWFSSYGFAEAGGLPTYGCADAVDGSDVHLFSDRFALIQAPRRVPGMELNVEAFNFTTTSDLAAKVLLNTEMDDFGVVEARPCGCLLGQVGYETHIREIFSFAKLTGEGVTLVGNDLVRILEEVLPQRFGGTPLDYQLVEEEDENNLTRLSLIIDPRVRIDEPSDVIGTVLAELKTIDAPSSMGAAIWAQTGSFRIKRMRPIITGTRGKLMPLHVSQRTPPT